MIDTPAPTPVPALEDRGNEVQLHWGNKKSTLFWSRTINLVFLTGLCRTRLHIATIWHGRRRKYSSFSSFAFLATSFYGGNEFHATTNLGKRLRLYRCSKPLHFCKRRYLPRNRRNALDPSSTAVQIWGHCRWGTLHTMWLSSGRCPRYLIYPKVNRVEAVDALLFRRIIVSLVGKAVIVQRTRDSEVRSKITGTLVLYPLHRCT